MATNEQKEGSAVFNIFKTDETLIQETVDFELANEDTSTVADIPDEIDDMQYKLNCELYVRRYTFNGIEWIKSAD